MNGIELRVIRETMGLSVSWIADALRVDRKTVTRWEAERQPVPDGVQCEVLGMRRDFDREVESAVGLVEREGNGIVWVHEAGESTEPVARARTEAFAGGRVYPALWHRLVAGEAARRTGAEIRLAPYDVLWIVATATAQQAKTHLLAHESLWFGPNDLRPNAYRLWFPIEAEQHHRRTVCARLDEAGVAYEVLTTAELRAKDAARVG